jgi:glutaredoxin
MGWALSLGAGLLGCRSTDAPPASGSVAPAEPGELAVDSKRTDLLYLWAGDAGVERATRVEDVPADRRHAVQVVDLSQPPEQRNAHAWVFVADLRTPGNEGRYTAKPVPRRGLEDALRAQVADAPRQASVTMYSAAWCGVCKKARAFLSGEGIPFVEKDIEKDPSAAEELRAKAAAAGVATGGVPMFDVGGQVLGGFDPQSLLTAIRR